MRHEFMIHVLLLPYREPQLSKQVEVNWAKLYSQVTF